MIRVDKSQVEVITPELLLALIESHDTTREAELHKMYIGQHKILEREFSDKTKPNNKIVANWCKYVSDSIVSFFMGKPVVYSSQDKKYMQEIQDIYDANDEQKVNIEIAQECSQYGWATEILFIKEDEKGKKVPKFASLPLSENNIVLIFDNSVEENLILAIRYWGSKDILTNVETVHAYVYTDSIIYHYVKMDNVFVYESEERHYFGKVPINYYWNKGRYLQSDFEDIITLNESYNSLISDDVNESEFSTDAILKTWGVEELNETQRMKEMRILNFGKVEKDEKSDAEWLVKDINSDWKENQKNRTLEDIHKLSKVPNMSDKSFAESSGVAIERRMLPLESVRSIKERYFKEGLQRRISMITKILNISNTYDYLDIDVKFQRNLPTDIQLAVQDAVNLVGTGLVSKQTLRKTIPFIDDPAYEKELIDEENDEYISLNVDQGGVNGTGTNNSPENQATGTGNGNSNQQKGKGNNQAI